MSDYKKSKKAYNNWRCRGEGRVYIAILFSMCEGVCPRCGKDMILIFNKREKALLENNVATLDHIIPLKETKRHNKMNLQIRCWECNNDKGSEIEARNNGKG